MIVDCLKQNKKNALIRSSENGHKEIAEMLLKMPNIDINIQDSVYFIHIFTKHEKL